MPLETKLGFAPAKQSSGSLIAKNVCHEADVKTVSRAISRTRLGETSGAAVGAAKLSMPNRTFQDSMETYEIDPIQDPGWEALVRNHPHTSVFHSTKWLKTLRNVYGYESAVITTCLPGSPLTNGLVFARVKSRVTGRRLVSLPFSDHCEPLLESPDQLEAILLRSRLDVRQGDWKYMEIRPLRHHPARAAEMEPLVTYRFHSLDLRPELEDLFRSFHKDCVQRKIHRAEREKLKYEEGNSETLLQKFYALLVMTRRRQYLPPQPVRWFRGLVANFGDDAKIHVASKDGVPVASILTLSHKRSMVYKYGCSNVAYNNLGGTALLFWKAIQEAKARGFEELELGRSDPANAGLVTFKDRWGASRSDITYWTYPRSHALGSNSWQWKAAQRMIPVMPDAVLKAVGGVMYKHIG